MIESSVPFGNCFILQLFFSTVRVNAFMFSELNLMGEYMTTQIASVRFLSSMNPEMFGQMAFF